MAHITSYDDFQASIQPGVTSAIAAAPWSISSSTSSSVTPAYNECFSYPFFGDDEFFFSCRGMPGTGSTFNFQWNFTANISVDMSQYGGATGLDFTWGYWPYLIGDPRPNSTSLFTDSQVGSRHFHEQVTVGTYGSSSAWESDNRVSQSGYTSVPVNPGERMGYIPVTLMSPVVHVDGEASVWFALKQINFTIVYPPPDSTSPVSTPPVSTSPVPTGTIVGAVIGGIVFILLLVTAIYLYRRKRRQRSDPLEKEGVGVEFEGTSSPLEKNGSVPDAGVASTSPPSWLGTNVPANALAVGHSDEPPSQLDNRVDHANTSEPAIFPPKASASSHAVMQTAAAGKGSSMRGEGTHASPQAAQDAYTHRSTIEPPPPFSTISDDMASTTQNPPPVYGSFANFSAWADSNRDLISEDLEARLLAAGYIPSDDPDTLTEDEWRTHGVMKLELIRLRRIYERDHQMHA